MAYFEVRSRHVPGEAKECHRKLCVRTADDPMKIPTERFPKRKQNRYRLATLPGNICSKYIRRKELLYSSDSLLTD